MLADHEDRVQCGVTQYYSIIIKTKFNVLLVPLENYDTQNYTWFYCLVWEKTLWSGELCVYSDMQWQIAQTLR